MPMLSKVWLVLVCSLVVAALIKRGLGLFETAIVVLTLGSAVCLVLSGCAVSCSAGSTPVSDPSAQWQRHNGRPVRWDRDDAPILLVVQDTAAYWVHHVQEAAERWNGALGFDLFRVADEVSPIAFALEENDAGIVPVMTSSATRAFTRFGLLPNARFVSCAILLPDDLDLALYGSSGYIVQHELGHAAGLDHDADPRSLMYPTIRIPPRFVPEIQEADREALRLWYGGKNAN